MRRAFGVKRSMAAITLVSTVMCVSLTRAALAQKKQVAEEQRHEFEEAVSKFMATTGAPGISAAVVENGEEAWSSGFGMADLENSVPATSSTLYRLGSISKPLTAAAAMELWEHGKIDLDAPVEKYCPAFPQKQWPITTRELLGHLGGIRHYRIAEGTPKSQDDPEIGNTKHFDDPIAGGLQFFANDALVAQPGSKFHYSTQGYTLVGCAIQGASGEKYSDFVRESIFVPAGMSHTVVDNRYAVIPHRTRFYQTNKSGAVENADFLDSSYKIPGGGWLSSADDLAEFEIALLDDRLVKRATRDVMWASQKTSDGKLTHYGLGWGVGTMESLADVSHGGSQQGTSTFVMIVPEKRAGAVVLINMENADAGALATELMKIALGLPADDQVK